MPEQGEKPAEHGDLKDMCDEYAEEMVRKVNMQPVSTRTNTVHYIPTLWCVHSVDTEFDKKWVV